MVLDRETHSEKNKNIEGLGIPSLLVGEKKRIKLATFNNLFL